MLVLVVVPLVVEVALGSIVRTGWCPEYVRGRLHSKLCHSPLGIKLWSQSSSPSIPVLSPGVRDFNKTAYLGQWYEHSNVFEWYQDLLVGES